MKRLLSILSICAFASSAFAQEAEATSSDSETQTETEAPQDAFPTESNLQQPGQPTEEVVGTFEDWQVRCLTEGDERQCFMYQLVTDGDNTPVIELSLIADPEGSDAALGATLVAPLMVNLQRGLILQRDEADPKQFAYNWCAPVGCYARFGMTDAEVAGYKSGINLTAVIFPLSARGQGIEVPLSLSGFTAAYDELVTLSAQ